eukprot:TRINITY_DN2415_c0_g1_i5.p1 TRINITY_DN2415_c0_g1~~TRINITY_DN2415_c0_g1_i5.p1  ORF type:complete len:160 (-),score=10.99 TRINITY_DN2415_c0_g1_i5:331-810(-)
MRQWLTPITKTSVAEVQHVLTVPAVVSRSHNRKHRARVTLHSSVVHLGRIGNFVLRELVGCVVATSLVLQDALPRIRAVSTEVHGYGDGHDIAGAAIHTGVNHAVRVALAAGALTIKEDTGAATYACKVGGDAPLQLCAQRSPRKAPFLPNLEHSKEEF